MGEVRLEGLNEVLMSIDEVANPQKFIQAMQRACDIVENTAKKKASEFRDTGDLYRSIANRIEQDDNGIIGVIYTPILYAPYVEFGTGLFAEEAGRKDVPWHYQDDKGNWHTTSGQHPQPFLRPALEENRESIKRILKEALTDD